MSLMHFDMSPKQTSSSVIGILPGVYKSCRKMLFNIYNHGPEKQDTAVFYLFVV